MRDIGAITASDGKFPPVGYESCHGWERFNGAGSVACGCTIQLIASASKPVRAGSVIELSVRKLSDFRLGRIFFAQCLSHCYLHEMPVQGIASDTVGDDDHAVV